MKKAEPYTLIPFKMDIPLPNGDTTTEQAIRQPNFGCRGWIFTEEEKDSIREAFCQITRNGNKKFSASEEKVTHLLNRLELLCSERKYWFLDRPKRAEVRESREHTLTDCRAALNRLRLVVNCEKDLWRYDNHEYFDSEEDDPVTDFRVQLWQDAKAALDPLEKFIKTVEAYHLSEKKSVGRDKGDTDNFIKKLRDIYVEYIGKRPTMTETGTFFTLVKAIYEILGLKIKDPSKTIRRALKKK